ncbi:hypothetical protein HU200_025878 [Digitaria exilis]|uniref:VQ domain-containing protein n=1 Tax=Digitaria exilis TaxID=1010633 RepID=A0A835C9F0_9POAL|nr:hypothetical protein HU200_025878 [Digitaria exilis]
MDHEQRRHQRSSRGNAPGSGAAGGASPGKHKGGGGGKGGGNKKPIKVVYISNPMRVETSAAGFRALVQELTGRDADPSKYSPDELVGEVASAAAAAAAAGDLDYGDAHGLSPGGAVGSCDTVVASPSPAAADQHPDAAAAMAAPYGADYDEEAEDEHGFRSQLLETNYTVFSPPTLLYDHHPHSKV